MIKTATDNEKLQNISTNKERSNILKKKDAINPNNVREKKEQQKGTKKTLSNAPLIRYDLNETLKSLIQDNLWSE